MIWMEGVVGVVNILVGHGMVTASSGPSVSLHWPMRAEHSPSLTNQRPPPLPPLTGQAWLSSSSHQPELRPGHSDQGRDRDTRHHMETSEEHQMPALTRGSLVLCCEV